MHIYYVHYLLRINFYRIPEWLRLEGTVMSHLAQPPCSGEHILQHMAEDCVHRVLEYHQ